MVKEYTKIKRTVNYDLEDVRKNLKQKMMTLKRKNTFGPENFEISNGSRKIRAFRFSKLLIARVPRLRPHRQNRNADRLRQNKRRLMVK